MTQNQKTQLIPHQTLAEILKKEKEKETPQTSSQFQSKISISNKSISSIGKGIPLKYLSVTHLLLHNNHLSSLSGIEAFQNLTHLSIASNDIESLSELSKIYNKSLITSLNVKKNFFFKNPQANIHLINLFPNMKYLDGFKISEATYKVIKGKAIFSCNNFIESKNLGSQIINFALLIKHRITALEKLYSMIKMNDEYTRKKINGMNSIDDIDNMIYKIHMLIKLNKVTILKKDYIEKYLNKNINPSVHVLKKIIEKSGLNNLNEQDQSIRNVKHEDYSLCYEELFSDIISLYESKSNYNELPSYLNYLVLKDNPFLQKFLINAMKQQSYEDKPIFNSPIEELSYICKGLPTLFMHYTNHSKNILLKYQMMYFYQLNKETDYLHGYHPANEDMMIYFDNHETEKINLDIFNNKVCHFLTQFECDSFSVFPLNFDYMRILTSIIQERIMEYKGKMDKLLFFNQLLEDRKKMFQPRKIKNVNGIKEGKEKELFMFHFAQNDMKNLKEDDYTKVLRGNIFNREDQHQKGLGNQHYEHSQDENYNNNTADLHIVHSYSHSNSKSKSKSNSHSQSKSHSKGENVSNSQSPSHHTYSNSFSHSNAQTKTRSKKLTNSSHGNNNNKQNSNTKTNSLINTNIKPINVFNQEHSSTISQEKQFTNNRYRNNDNNTSINKRSNSEECNKNLNMQLQQNNDHLENIPFTIKSNEQFTLANNDDDYENHPVTHLNYHRNINLNKINNKTAKPQMNHIKSTTYPNKKNTQKSHKTSYSPNKKTDNEIIKQVKKDNRSTALIKRYLKYNNGLITLDMISRLSLMKIFFNKLSLHSIQLKLPYLACALDHIREIKAKRKLLESLFIYNNIVTFAIYKHQKIIKGKLMKILKQYKVISKHLKKGYHYSVKTKGFFSLYSHMKKSSIKKQRYNRIKYYYYNKMIKKFWLTIKFNHHIKKDTHTSHYVSINNNDYDEINRYPHGKFKNLTYTPNSNLNSCNNNDANQNEVYQEKEDEEYKKVYNFFHNEDNENNNEQFFSTSYHHESNGSSQFNKSGLLSKTEKNKSNMVINEEEHEESEQKEENSNGKSVNEVNNLIDHLEARLSSISKSSKNSSSKYENEKCSFDISNSNSNNTANNKDNKSINIQSKSMKKAKSTKEYNELCPYCISGIKHTQCISQNGTPFNTITQTSSSKTKKDILTPSNAKILLLGAPNYIRNTPTFIHKKLK